MFAWKWKTPFLTTANICLQWRANQCHSSGKECWLYKKGDPEMPSSAIPHLYSNASCGSNALTVGGVCTWVRGCGCRQAEWKRSSKLTIEKYIPVEELGDFPKEKKSKFCLWGHSTLVNLPHIVNNAITQIHWFKIRKNEYVQNSQAPLSMRVSREEYWNGLPYPSPGNVLNPGTEPITLVSLALASRFFTISTTWKAHYTDKFI